MNGPVTLINAFSVPVAESERFLSSWKESARIMDRQPGFINVAEWASRELFEKAIATPEFRASAQRMIEDPDLHITARPAVYEVAVTVHPDEVLP
jgi:heme-degrading monooxygenase HmoA